MIKVGITGGIGSGKSTVCKKFEELGIPIFDSDSHAKAYYVNTDVKHKLVDLFGINVLHNNEVDKKQLANMVFSDITKLDKLTKIMEPYVLEDFNACCQHYSSKPYIIFESAILHRQNLTGLFDKIIIVSADKNIRLARAMQRNQSNSEDVLLVMNAQLSDEELKAQKYDFIINNDGQEDITEHVLQIHNNLSNSIT